MEAGLGILPRMGENSLDRVLLVLNPSVKSIEVVRRALQIIVERKITASPVVVANRIRGETDLEPVRAALNGVEMVLVPEDPEIRMADVHALSPFDAAPHSPAVQVIVKLARSWAA